MSTTSKKGGGRKNTIMRAENWPPASVLNPGPHQTFHREVVLDLHNTCVDWTGRFAEFVNVHFDHKLDPRFLNYYHMQFDPDNSLTDEQFKACFVAFARLARGGYGDLEPYPHIVKAIQRMKDAGIDVKVWTWTPGATERRMDNASGYRSGIAQGVTKDLVAKLGLDPSRDLRFMKPGDKKYELAEDDIPLIIEDSPETAVGVGQMAHAAILVPQPYNEGVQAPNVLRLNHHEQLAPTVIHFFKELEKAGVLLD